MPEVLRTIREERVLPSTIFCYHAGPSATDSEIRRAIEEMKQGNPPLASIYVRWYPVSGSSRRIGHIPPGYKGIPADYRSELQIMVADLRTVREIIRHKAQLVNGYAICSKGHRNYYAYTGDHNCKTCDDAMTLHL